MIDSSPCRIFDDAADSPRLIYALGAFLNDRPYFPPGYARRFTEKFRRDRESLSESDRYDAQLLHDYNTALFTSAGSMRGSVIILTTGFSVDGFQHTGYPYLIGVDSTNPRNRLYGEFQSIVSKVDREVRQNTGYGFPYGNVEFVQVGSVIWTCEIDERSSVVHSVPQAIKVANKSALKTGRLQFTYFDRPLGCNEVRTPNYEFTNGFFVPSKRRFRESSLFNVYIVANAYAAFLDRCLTVPNEKTHSEDPIQLKGINLWAEKGSVPAKIIERVKRILQEDYNKDFELRHFSGPMRTANRPRLAECTPSALKIIKGYFTGLAEDLRSPV